MLNPQDTKTGQTLHTHWCVEPALHALNVLFLLHQFSTIFRHLPCNEPFDSVMIKTAKTLL